MRPSDPTKLVLYPLRNGRTAKTVVDAPYRVNQVGVAATQNSKETPPIVAVGSSVLWTLAPVSAFALSQEISLLKSREIHCVSKPTLDEAVMMSIWSSVGATDDTPNTTQTEPIWHR